MEEGPRSPRNKGEGGGESVIEKGTSSSGKTKTKTKKTKAKEHLVSHESDDDMDARKEGGEDKHHNTKERKRTATVVGRLNHMLLHKEDSYDTLHALALEEGQDAPEKQGRLFKEGGKWKTWKERWFVLKDGALFYKPSYSSKKVIDRVDLTQTTLSVVERYTNAKHEMRSCIVIAMNPAVEGAKNFRKWYLFDQENSMETIQWLEAMQESVTRMHRAQRRKARRNTIDAPPSPATRARSASNART